MPAKKKAITVKKTRARKETNNVSDLRPVDFSSAEETRTDNSRKVFPLYIVIPLILLLAALGALIWKNKGFLVAATVNGSPVWRITLEKRLDDQYGQQTLDEMINEKLIEDSSAKKGIKVSDSEINDKISGIEKTLGGNSNLTAALSQQGLTMSEFKHQISLQIMVEKLLADKISVSDQEVTDYIDKNRSSLTATDEAGMKDEAKNILVSQKRNAAFQDFFNSLKNSSKIVKYF